MQVQEEYHPHILPDNCEWYCAIANADGYNGHAYVANVYRDQSGDLWVCAKSGRFRMPKKTVDRKQISNKALIGAPYHFSPVGNA